MASRVVRPETVKLDISQGDWLLVKKRLNAGEQRAMFARMYVAGVDGRLQSNPLGISVAKILAYLLDWSLTDPQGKQIRIAGQSVTVVQEALDSLDPDSFGEIRRAVDAHEEAMAVEREQEKNDRAGESTSAAISPLPSAAAGALTGSVN